MFSLPIIGDIWNEVSGVFSDFAGWAVDSVISAITTWVIAGVLALIEAFWSVIDTSTRPTVTADWFSGAATSPFQLAMGIGALMMLLTLFVAVIRAVLAGSPGGIIKAVGRDLPMAVFTMFATIVFTQVAIDLADSIGDWVWAGTRDDASKALEHVSVVLMGGLSSAQFLGVVIALALLLAMLFLWVTLYVREALIYLVIVFSAAFAWPMMVFPPLRDTAKKAGEMLLALIICKPIIVLALSVGVSALAGFTDPGSGGGDGGLTGQIGTMVVGVITFGLAAFMPFLVWKLMPLVAAAVVAQGVTGGPMRAAQQGMQMQYHGSAMMGRLTGGGKVPGVSARSAAPGGGAGATSAAAAGGSGAAAGGVGAAAASGPAAAVAIPLAALKAAAGAAKSTATSMATSATSTTSTATPSTPMPPAPPTAASGSGPTGGVS